MFATQCSKPQRTNAEIGGYTARILPETWVALMPIQTATQTITLHRIPRKKTSEKLRETFVTAVFTMFCASSPSYSPGICPYTNRTDTNREPIRLPR